MKIVTDELKEKIVEEYSKTKSIRNVSIILKIGTKNIKKVLIEKNLFDPKIYQRSPVNDSLVKVGDKFGRWTVLEKNIRTNDNGRYCTSVICECGTEHIIRTQHLLKGKSLGCKYCINKNNYPTFRKSSAHPDINLKGLSPVWITSIKTNLSRGMYRKLSLEIDSYDLLHQLEKQNFKCAYTGESLNVLNISKYLSNASVDRIDSTKDYTKDNIQWILKTVNKMKNAFTEKEFLNTCFQIYKFKHDNFEPSSVNDIKVTEKVQRLEGEESTNNPSTSAQQPIAK